MARPATPLAQLTLCGMDQRHIAFAGDNRAKFTVTEECEIDDIVEENTFNCVLHDFPGVIKGETSLSDANEPSAE
jgi:hypothetical protein